MKLDSQCCNVEHAAYLKASGITQKSNFYFVADDPLGKGRLVSGGQLLHKYHWAAFTVAELGRMLPTGYYTMRLEVAGQDRWFAFDNKGRACLQNDTFTTEAEARVMVLINLLKTNQVKADDVNARLSS